MLWSGKPLGIKREARVGFMMKTTLSYSLKPIVNNISERIITMRYQMAKSQHVTLISVYEPTMTHNDAAKESFYRQLEDTLSHVCPTDKLFLLGDFNARVGCDWSTWPGTLGRNGVGKFNSNGLLLLDLSTKFNLSINFYIKPENQYSLCVI